MSQTPKSSFELAMERLRQEDDEAGVAPSPLTDAQKTEIAETRRIYASRLAEREILHQDALRKANDPAVKELLDEELRRDRDRIRGDEERAVAKLKEAR